MCCSCPLKLFSCSYCNEYAKHWVYGHVSVYVHLKLHQSHQRKEKRLNSLEEDGDKNSERNGEKRVFWIFQLLSLTTHLICFSPTPVQFNYILNKGEENPNPTNPLDIVYCFLFIRFYCGILGFLCFHRTCCIYQVLLHQWLLVSSLNVTIALNVSVKTPVWLFMMLFPQISVHSLKTTD